MFAAHCSKGSKWVPPSRLPCQEPAAHLGSGSAGACWEVASRIMSDLAAQQPHPCQTVFGEMPVTVPFCESLAIFSSLMMENIGKHIALPKFPVTFPPNLRMNSPRCHRAMSPPPSPAHSPRPPSEPERNDMGQNLSAVSPPARINGQKSSGTATPLYFGSERRIVCCQILQCALHES